MDELETGDATELGERTEIVEETPDSASKLKNAIVRIGWGICAVGLLITIIGTGQRASAASFADAGGRVIHSLGLLTLLLGAVTTLFGYRLPWIAALNRSIQSQQSPRTNSHSRVIESRSIHPPHDNPANLLLFLVAGGGFWALSFFLVWLSPFVVTGLYLATVTFIFTAAAIVTIASGTRLQRAFSIGAVIPLLLAVCNIWIYSFSTFAPAMRRNTIYSASSPESLWDSLGTQAEILNNMFVNLGTGARVPILFAWLAALAIGSSALFFRILLMRINREFVDSTHD